MNATTTETTVVTTILERREFIGFALEDEVSYPVMASSAMTLFEDDQEAFDEIILDSLIHV